MIVTIRREEIKAVLSAYFRVAVDDFVIGPVNPSELGKRARASVNRPLDNALKIGNIRALRELANGLGHQITLQEAKWALEHWLEWINFVDEYNRLPAEGYASQMTYGQLK